MVFMCLRLLTRGQTDLVRYFIATHMGTWCVENQLERFIKDIPCVWLHRLMFVTWSTEHEKQCMLNLLRGLFLGKRVDGDTAKIRNGDADTICVDIANGVDVNLDYVDIMRCFNIVVHSRHRGNFVIFCADFAPHEMSSLFQPPYNHYQPVIVPIKLLLP